jgi:hypothetical protein
MLIGESYVAGHEQVSSLLFQYVCVCVCVCVCVSGTNFILKILYTLDDNPLEITN